MNKLSPAQFVTIVRAVAAQLDDGAGRITLAFHGADSATLASVQALLPHRGHGPELREGGGHTWMAAESCDDAPGARLRTVGAFGAHSAIEAVGAGEAVKV